jgi:hypothetical protein
VILSDHYGFILIKTQKTLGASIEVGLIGRVESSRAKREVSTNGLVDQADLTDPQRETSVMSCGQTLREHGPYPEAR